MNQIYRNGKGISFFLVAAGTSAATSLAAPSASAAATDATTLEGALAQGWVHVPGAVVHPECVHLRSDGGMLNENGDVTVNGHVVDHYGKCPHASFSTLPGRGSPLRNSGGAGLGVATGGAAAPVTSGGDVVTHPPLAGGSQGYAVDIYAETPGGVDRFDNQFEVPANPPVLTDNQLVYLWSGVENFNGNLISQSVIQFGGNVPGQSAGRGIAGHWSAAAWVGVNGHYTASGALPVSTGDTIESTQTMAFGGWFAQVTDVTTGRSTVTAVATSNPPNVVLAAVLETANVFSCRDLSSSNFDFFTFPAVTLGGSNVAVTWDAGANYNGPANCSYAAGVFYGQLFYLTWTS